ncbi:MAG TPA: ABC transporter permease [Elusimicrobiales bacterium]|nr:ABC transporter permease [Elusimicrobiales bacterium]
MGITLRAFIRKELVQTLRDTRRRVLLFGAPVIQLTIFGLALSTEIKNIRLAVFSRPDDAMFLRLAERFYASGWFVPAVRGPGDDPMELIASGGADAALIAPAEGLRRSAERGSGKMQLLVDASNASKARAVEAYSKSVISEAALREYGTPLRTPVRFDVRVLYNPAMRSSLYLVPGVMGMLVCLITIILTAMSLAREREVGTFETIVSAPLSDLEVLLGKTVPYVILGLLDAALVVGAGYMIFGVPVRGPLWQLALASMVFVVATVAIGTFVSTVSRNQQQAMLGGFIFLFPAMLMSGIMYPVENMPGAMIAAAYLDPLMYFVRLLRNIMLKGGDPGVFWTDVGAMALMALASAGLAYRRFRRTLN